MGTGTGSNACENISIDHS